MTVAVVLNKLKSYAVSMAVFIFYKALDELKSRASETSLHYRKYQDVLLVIVLKQLH